MPMQQAAVATWCGLVQDLVHALSRSTGPGMAMLGMDGHVLSLIEGVALYGWKLLSGHCAFVHVFTSVLPSRQLR